MNIDKALADLIERVIEATELLDKSVDALTSATVVAVDIKDEVNKVNEVNDAKNEIT